MDKRDTRQFQGDDGDTWTVARVPGFRGVRGLRFTSSKSVRLFLPRGLNDLPSRKELQTMLEGELRKLLFLAKPEGPQPIP